jgi:signal transduction histidine kinase
VDLTAYRIVQEALTNVVRHAHARRVTVELEYQLDAVLVTVTDDGVGPQQARAGRNGADAGGQGLVGMRERVALFGGGLHAGARADAPGYEVRALLPTGT